MSTALGLQARPGFLRDRGHHPDEEIGIALVPLDSPGTPGPTIRPAEGYMEPRDSSGAGSKYGLLNFHQRTQIGVFDSLKAILTSSALNMFAIFIPLSWIAHFQPRWTNHAHTVTFILSFFALVPLEHIFEWGGEQLALFCGEDVGDLIAITFHNIVEATVATILLLKCELKLVQATVIGNVLLHLLLIPGTAFVTGGARIMYQDLHEDRAQLNHTLLTIGVMSFLIPAAFFAATNRGGVIRSVNDTTTIGSLVNDDSRHQFLIISRGLAMILLIVYISSRVYLHNPPPTPPSRTSTRSETEYKFESEEEPVTNPWVLIVFLLVSLGIMAATTEFLVKSVETVRGRSDITEEFFGMILLPFTSFAADGFVTVIFFLRYLLRQFREETEPPRERAKARNIDRSIQFTLFWMPLFILLAWWLDKPLTLLFDFFEIAVLIGSCFIVNYVTADAKTNWSEGLAMVGFYFMIAVSVWFYTGQQEIQILLGCASVADNIEKFAENGFRGVTGKGGGD